MFKFSTKAKTLLKVQDELIQFKIPEFSVFSVLEFLKNENKQCEIISKKFSDRKIAIRSSSYDEDGGTTSMAGQYETVLNVDASSITVIRTAINKVIDSYKKRNLNEGIDEFIVQEMITDISMSGVIFTHDLHTGAPYYVINYDDQSGRTDTVTSGNGAYSNRTIYIFRGKQDSIKSERFRRLINAVNELEIVTKHDLLDIEFALTKNLEPILFQVREITTHCNWNRDISKRVAASLRGINHFLDFKLKRVNGVYGNRTILGQMPDWNPAEMIGRAPRALAFSIYKKLITDDVWRIARDKMGYFSPAGQGLMVSLSGQPFIDVRLSLNSFLPKGLSIEVSEKLVNHWINRLEESPELHDKLEFEVAITSFSFNFDNKINLLAENILDINEKKIFRNLALHQLKEILQDSHIGSLKNALSEIGSLKNKYFKISDFSIQNLNMMVDDCKKLGTIPFAIIARHAFIAKGLMNSLIEMGIIDKLELESINTGIQTISSEFIDDIIRYKSGEINLDDFMNIYGHLRPGTYDILSDKYKSIGEPLLSNAIYDEKLPVKNKYKISTNVLEKIDILLKENGFMNFDSGSLLQYYQESITAREYAKFIFTKVVSEILDSISEFANVTGLTVEEISNITLEEIICCLDASQDGFLEDHLRSIATQNREKHRISSAIRLPQILSNSDGIYVVPFQISQPNFITSKKVEASVVYIDGVECANNICGCIVAIENADPGFDWIFSRKILGLVTKYGGANSHMAIRCAEFEIPAAIGCGEQRFERILISKKISLDCLSGSINEIH